MVLQSWSFSCKRHSLLCILRFINFDKYGPLRSSVRARYDPQALDWANLQSLDLEMQVFVYLGILFRACHQVPTSCKDRRLLFCRTSIVCRRLSIMCSTKKTEQHSLYQSLGYGFGLAGSHLNDFCSTWSQDLGCSLICSGPVMKPDPSNLFFLIGNLLTWNRFWLFNCCPGFRIQFCHKKQAVNDE